MDLAAINTDDIAGFAKTVNRLTNEPGNRHNTAIYEISIVNVPSIISNTDIVIVLDSMIEAADTSVAYSCETNLMNIVGTRLDCY